MSTIVGRKREQSLLDQIAGSTEAELLAIYGRRRVGKTHLIREYFEPRADLYFTITGEKDAPKKTQLFHFQREMERVFYDGAPIPRITSWEEALDLLTAAISNQVEHHGVEQVVVFLDELPWLSTPKSRLIQSLDHQWNTRLGQHKQVRLVVCGSAASWMLDNLIHAKGGLHNRITRRIRLEPFTLGEAREFLASRGIKLTRSQVIEIYMAIGGVPHYLKMMQRGLSAAQNIGETCFHRGGELHDEFGRLYASLFSEAPVYEKIVRVLASNRSGVPRQQLLDALGATSGGRLGRRLGELEEAGFIASLTPHGNRIKSTAYRLVDEYSLFYLKWIEPSPRGVLAGAGDAYWLNKVQTSGYRAWAGYAFEGICLKHAQQIKRALGIASVAAEVGTWRYIPRSGKTSRRAGAQVDLLFDRADGVITLCECKHSGEPFQVTKSYARELKEKLDIFEQRTKTKKQLHLALVTTHGLKPNTWSEGLIDRVVTADDLFDDDG